MITSLACFKPYYYILKLYIREKHETKHKISNQTYIYIYIHVQASHTCLWILTCNSYPIKLILTIHNILHHCHHFNYILGDLRHIKTNPKQLLTHPKRIRTRGNSRSPWTQVSNTNNFNFLFLDLLLLHHFKTSPHTHLESHTHD